MKYIYPILITFLLLSSCAEEQTGHNSVQRLNISFADTRTRSIWSDRTDTENKVVSYIWDESNTNMLTAIKHGSRYVPFYESMTSTAEYYSRTHFETVDQEKSKIKLRTEKGVKLDVVNDAYVFPVAAGDEMYCFHPINDFTTINPGESAVTVDMELPHTFKYDQLTNDLSSLADYSYVYTSTTLQSVDAGNVVAKASHFNSACAIIRFNITNHITSDILITKVKMEADDNMPIFPNVLRFSDGSVAEQTDKTGYYSRLTTEIQSVTIPKQQTGIFYNLCFPLDGDFNQVPLKFTIDTNYLTYQLRLNSDLITNHKFEAGKIYTFNFTLEEKEIRLNTLDIAQCTTYNIDNAESLSIVVSPNAVWDQMGQESAQMVFVSLGMTTTIGDKEYDVLWATCNLGAMEPIETGNHYAWGEVTKKSASKYSPEDYTGTATTDIHNTENDVVKAYLGGGHWLWCMPTQKMWQDLVDNCEWKWKPVKKISDASTAEENDFDASVWEVTKRDKNNQLIGLIYFPITGYSGWDESTGTYKKVNKRFCYYWTSTPAPDSNGSGATEKSWAFETTYEIDPGTGDGKMTDPKIIECERYNGYAIRPVLLKEKN